jgi:hypothetical protein
MPGDIDTKAPISQKNMDYSMFKALNFNMGGIEAALICYDVMCQWSVHIRDRVTDKYSREIYIGAEFGGVSVEDGDDGHNSAAKEHHPAQLPS